MTYHLIAAPALQDHWIFAFYGFGQQASVFDKLVELCSHKYGLIIFDLPYEQLASIPSKSDFTGEMNELIERNHIQKITAISYSIGSRYVLLLAETLPAYLSQMFLIAPDGISINLWNRIATSTWAGHYLFRNLMQHPAQYLKILQFLFQLKLLPENLFAFIRWQVRNKSNSMKVYNTWMNMRHMIPDLSLIDRNQRKYLFNVNAFFGRHDFVIRDKVSNKLKKSIPAAKIILLESDHNLLNDSLFHHIAAYL